MSEELKPCPFCGGEPNLTHDDYVHDDLRPMPVVECKSCSAWVQAADWNRRAALSAQQSAPVTGEPSPLEVIGYASPGQIEILRELPRTGGMKVKGRKDDRYSEPVVLLSDARAAMISLAARCQQEGAFKTCLECGYQDGHDDICQFHASNRKPQQSAPERVSVPVEQLKIATEILLDPRAYGVGLAMVHGKKLRALLASHQRGEA